MPSVRVARRGIDRVEGLQKARGGSTFTANAIPQPHLFGGLITARRAHAHVHLDGTAARAVPGVVAVLGPDDDPGVLWCPDPHSGAADSAVFTAEARFPGDVVGAIAAVSRSALAAGLAAMDVVEEPLPAVLSMADAAAGDGLANSAHPGNVIVDDRFGVTDAELADAMAGADHIFEHAYSFDPVPHGFLERVAAGAAWIDDRCHVWSTTQCPFLVRDRLAPLLGVEAERIVMEPVMVGGGFGGKEEMALEPVAALLSKACGGRRVLVEIDRATSTGRLRSRHGGTITLRTGTDATGVFLARHIDVVFDGGAYDGHSHAVAGNAASMAAQLYPDAVIGARARSLCTNRTPGGAFRGYGGVQAVFAVESQVDEIAHALGLDPVALRRMNAPSPASVDPFTGWPMRSISTRECLEVGAPGMASMTGSSAVSADRRFRRGVGMACVVNVSSASNAEALDVARAACRVDAGVDAIVVETTAVELGQGLHTTLATIAAEVLGVDAERITVEQLSTEHGPRDRGAFGSGGAYVSGSAVVAAAGALRTALFERAAALGRSPTSPMHLCADASVAIDDRRVGVGALGPLREEESYTAPDNALVGGAQFAAVTVDTATGVVAVDRVVSVHDIGRVLHPDLARSQVEGGVVQGIGSALTERLRHRPDGSPMERGYLDHLVPTVAHGATIDAVFVEDRPNPEGSTGAKGLGEPPILGVAPAIANAIFAATGVRMRELPMTPERVLRALDAAGKGWLKKAAT